VTDLLCQRCDSPALVIYEQESLCGPCAVRAVNEHQHYLVVQVDDTGEQEDNGADSSSQASNSG